jgi:hypothetical protein
VGGSGKNRFRIRDLFADEWCSQATLDFRLYARDVERRVGSDRAVEEAQSEASESELQEREVRQEEIAVGGGRAGRSKGAIVRYLVSLGG